MAAYGLQTHIWSNNTKSLLLMAGFPVLLVLLTYGLFLLWAGFVGVPVPAGVDPMIAPFIWAGDALVKAWPYAIVGAIVWFGIAYAFYQAMIDAATGSQKIERSAEPELYNLLENLCISRGIKMPALRIMETEGLNAFATGLHEGQYSITVTRGLMRRLNRDELEAVLAHELTHIRNLDVRLLIIAVIFVGIFSFVGEMAFRGLWHSGGGRSSRSSGDSRESGGQLVAVIAALVIIGVAYALAIVIRFALSRRREYLADAGAVELTKNPDAMISALQKIEGNAHVQAPSEVREMFIENAHSDFASLFATHPPIEKRIQTLEKMAGGRRAVLTPEIADAPRAAPGPWDQTPSRKGPWDRA